MGKGDKSGPGRALVKHHNRMVQLSKEKSHFYRRQQKNVLESVTEVGDIEAVIEQAEEAGLAYAAENPLPSIIHLDVSSAGDDLTPEERIRQQKNEEALYASSLQVPRRPPWNSKMSVEELDANERQAFLAWRRNLARLEQNEKLVLTPFEKNLDIWRQLWRVLERSDLLVMVVDARDPLFYRCPDLEAYALEIDRHKQTLLLVNKADLLPVNIRQSWANYFQSQGILHVFWSAKAASADLEGKKLSSSPWMEQSSLQDLDASSLDTKVFGRDELLVRLQMEAESIVSRRRLDKVKVSPRSASQAPNHVVVGFVGYPNVGKSSTINALVGEKRTGVTSTPGKTKHFQTLKISDGLVLCDCPGLVFPSFSSSRYEMIASGVLPIDRMSEHRQAVQVVADHVPRDALESIYNITLPKPKPYESHSRPPLASELLRSYCSSRGYVSSSGLPDETRAARQILKDYIGGKLPHFKMPPEESECRHADLDEDRQHLESAHEPESSEGDDIDSVNSSGADPYLEANEGIAGTDLRNVASLLHSFDFAHALSSPATSVAAKKKASASTSNKRHKKPQRKKDRSWRVRNDGDDGMPIVRGFQKPVNLGPLAAS